MIKILLCCGGGFSSSALVNKIKKEIEENDMQEDYHIEFAPFSMAPHKAHEFDIIMCCPHLKFSVDKLVKEKELDTPIYILPPVMYGTIKAKEVTLDAMDVIDLYKENKVNPVYFPGEENIHRVTRGCAYRNKK